MQESEDYISEDECRESGMHLTSCDKDGYCNRCGSRRPNDPTEVWIELHTAAPYVYDGFSTKTLEVVGRDKKGNDVRKIAVKRRDYTWQTQRYDSGLCAFTNERMTLEDYVRFGDWTLNLETTRAEDRRGT